MIISPSQGVRKGPSPYPAPIRCSPSSVVPGLWGLRPLRRGPLRPELSCPLGSPISVACKDRATEGRSVTPPLWQAPQQGRDPARTPQLCPVSISSAAEQGLNTFLSWSLGPTLLEASDVPVEWGGGVVKDRMGGPTSSHPSRCVQKRGLRREVRVGQGACGKRASSQRVGWVTLDITVSVLSRVKGHPAQRQGRLAGDNWRLMIPEHCASQFRSAEAAKQWNVGGRRHVSDPGGPAPPLLMEVAAWNGSGWWAASRATRWQQVGAAQGGEWARTREAGSLALPVALQPLRSGSPFSQARRCE